MKEKLKRLRQLWDAFKHADQEMIDELLQVIEFQEERIEALENKLEMPEPRKSEQSQEVKAFIKYIREYKGLKGDDLKDYEKQTLRYYFGK